MAEPKKKKIRWSAAWGDARELSWTHRRRLMLGAVLMLINQAMGLVLPASTKFLIDQVIVKGRVDLLWKIAVAAGARAHNPTLPNLRLLPAAGRCGAACHHGNAQEGPGQDCPLAGQLFRFNAGRQTYFAHHE